MESKIQEEIENIIKLTNERKIKWTYTGVGSVPIYQWERSIDNIKYFVSIQRGVSGFIYFFILKETAPKSGKTESVVSINDSKDKTSSAILLKLFNAVVNSIDIEKIELMKKLTSGL